ncbi:MAG: serine/threonine protein phosphatase [Lachnospiraceae bacterium]|nr:serine/threonine protein phosphatase [Lachnospiraceae bacterium]
MCQGETQIVKLDLEENKRIIAISDIHGCVDYLEGVLKKAQYSKEDILIIVGDIIEKGKDSLKTIRYLMNLRRDNVNVYATMGNVDYDRVKSFMDNSLEGNERFLHSLQWTKNVWKRGLFLDILKELGIALDAIREENIADIKKRIWERYQEELEFLWKLPTILAIGNYIFVHAGIPTDSLEKLQGTEAFNYLKIDAFMKSNVRFEKYVIVGHWPVCLYREDIDCMNPVFDYEKHIIGIDGGCGLKRGAQLNALLIPGAKADMHEISYVSYDDYPMVTALQSQEPKDKTIRIHFSDCEVVLSEEKNREENNRKEYGTKENDTKENNGVNNNKEQNNGEKNSREENKGGENGAKDNEEMVSLYHINTKRNFRAPHSYLYQRKGKLFCEDYSDAYLTVSEGETLSLIVKTQEGLMVKKDGMIGWYKGSYRENYKEDYKGNYM